MIYLIIGILILLFYVFAIPTSIKGTLNVLTFVLLLVTLIILLALAIFQIFKLPGELFVSIFLIIITVWALMDIERLVPSQKSKEL